jgi:hypothetical protein
VAVDDSYTKILLHMQGSDGGTIFTDEGGHPFSAIANAVTATANKKFGLSSMYDDDQSGIQATGTTGLAYGTTDFTLDGWVFPVGIDQDPLVQTDGDDRFIFYWLGNGELYMTDNWSGVSSAAGIGIGLHRWNHIAYVRFSGTFMFFVDGFLGPNTYNDWYTTHDFGNIVTFTVGYGWGGNAIKGYVSEVRFSLGIARWTKNFIPPKFAYGLGHGAHLATRGRYRIPAKVR